MIQLLKPLIHDISMSNVKEVLSSGWIGLGPVTAKFESKVGERLGAKHVVAMNSGTDALRCAVALCDAKPKSVFITTPNTFVSTNHVIIEAGYRIHFADINPCDGMISAESVERILRSEPDVGGIMVVHYGGMPCDLEAIRKLAQEFGVPIIEDAAHAFGAEYRGVKIGSETRFGCFSLHAVKPLCVGDGGLLTTDSAEIAEAARKWRWLGINKSTADRSDHTKYAWDYDVEMVGHKSHMNDITAAIGLGQLACYDSDFRLRKQLVDFYRSQLQGVDTLNLYDDRVSANHLMVVLCKSWKHRDAIAKKLAENDIQTGMHYKPNYVYPMYKDFPRDGGCEYTENFSQVALTLPLHLYLTGSDIERIAWIIDNV